MANVSGSHLPVLSAEQRSANLQKGYEARQHRARFLAALRSEQISAGEGLDQALGDEVLARTKVISFLQALPRWGKISVEQVMSDIGIAENRRLRGLGRNQLNEVRHAVVK